MHGQRGSLLSNHQWWSMHSFHITWVWEEKSNPEQVDVTLQKINMGPENNWFLDIFSPTYLPGSILIYSTLTALKGQEVWHSTAPSSMYLLIVPLFQNPAIAHRWASCLENQWKIPLVFIVQTILDLCGLAIPLDGGISSLWKSL